MSAFRIVFAVVCWGGLSAFVLAGPRRSRHPLELAAVGVTDRSLGQTAAVLTVMVTVGGGGTAAYMVGPEIGLGVGVVLFLLSSLGMAAMVEQMTLSSFRQRRDKASLRFMRVVRLSLAAGAPLTEAAQSAVEENTTRVFETVRSNLRAAVASHEDPLEAIARSLAGSPAGNALGAASTAERVGAAGGVEIDRMVDTAILRLQQIRRLRIDRLSHATAIVSTLATVLVTILLLAAVASTIQF